MSELVEQSDNKKHSTETKEQLIEFKYKFRNSLPRYMVDRSTSSVWAILKQCVDKVSIFGRKNYHYIYLCIHMSHYV